MVIDRLAVKDTARRRLTDSIETALASRAASSSSTSSTCRRTTRTASGCLRAPGLPLRRPLVRRARAADASRFNSPWGACPECTGLGTKMEVDPELIVPDPAKSLDEGAIAPWAGGHVSDYFDRLIEALAETIGFRLDTPWEKLPAKAKKALLYGHETQVHVRYKNRYGRERSYYTDYEGAITYVERRHAEAESDSSREKFAGFMREVPCPSCHGTQAQADLAGGHDRRQVDRGLLPRADRRAGQDPAQPGAVRPGHADRPADPQGSQRAARLPARRRPRLPHPRPGGGDAGRRRGAADPARHPDRLRPRRRALRARRAVDRPAPARQPEAARHPAAAARPRQHADRGRARRGHDPRRRLGGRHRARRRRARRPHRRLRHRSTSSSTARSR